MKIPVAVDAEKKNKLVVLDDVVNGKKSGKEVEVLLAECIIDIYSRIP